MFFNLSRNFLTSCSFGRSFGIVVRYENNGSANEESFFVVNGQPGWFNTGDMGHLDEQVTTHS